MKILHCPRCQQYSLVPTGAFWACGSCRYAITGIALSVELTQPANGKAIGRQPGGETPR